MNPSGKPSEEEEWTSTKDKTTGVRFLLSLRYRNDSKKRTPVLQCGLV